MWRDVVEQSRLSFADSRHGFRCRRISRLHAFIALRSGPLRLLRLLPLLPGTSRLPGLHRNDLMLGHYRRLCSCRRDTRTMGIGRLRNGHRCRRRLLQLGSWGSCSPSVAENLRRLSTLWKELISSLCRRWGDCCWADPRERERDLPLHVLGEQGGIHDLGELGPPLVFAREELG